VAIPTIIAIVYGVVALGGIAWLIEQQAVSSLEQNWPRMRRHGITMAEHDFSMLLGMLALCFKAIMHALDIAKVGKAPWIDFVGTTVIVLMAVGYAMGHRKNRSASHAMRRTALFFSPLMAAMTLDQFFDKAARAIIYLGF